MMALEWIQDVVTTMPGYLIVRHKQTGRKMKVQLCGSVNSNSRFYSRIEGRDGEGLPSLVAGNDLDNWEVIKKYVPKWAR